MERIAGCPNLRDMGGIKVKNGYVKPGRLIRSGALWRLEDKDIEKLGSIAAVYDMRSENERAYHPDPEIPGAEYIHIPITENGRRRFVQSKRTLSDKVEDMLEGYRCSEPASAQRMREVYSGMVLSADAGRCLEGIIRTVVEQREGAVIPLLCRQGQGGGDIRPASSPSGRRGQRHIRGLSIYQHRPFP